jgi:hypothetical protein
MSASPQDSWRAPATPPTAAPAPRREMPERIALLHATRYLPWVRYLAGESGGRRGRCPEALELAVAVAIEGSSLARCDRARRW